MAQDQHGLTEQLMPAVAAPAYITLVLLDQVALVVVALVVLLALEEIMDHLI